MLLAPPASAHMSCPAHAAATARLWPMERQVLADFEGVGRGSLARRARFATAVGLDVRTVAANVRTTRAEAGGTCDDGEAGRALSEIAAQSRDVAALARVLGDLARMGTVLQDGKVRLFTTATLPASDVRHLAALTRDAEAEQASLGSTRDTGLARAERADLAVEARGLRALEAGTLTPAQVLLLAAEARIRTQEMGDRIDPFRARMRTRLRAEIRRLGSAAQGARSDDAAER